ncbi:MAG TPA: STAS domain-containing protein, partial [Hyphomicrobium sp.]|nr:STAS domain-containing protein [Hyphomicrobium sp.]
WGDAAVLLATFLLTIFVDLSTAIAVGVTLGAFLFLHRMAEAVEVETGAPLIKDDVADSLEIEQTPDLGKDVMVYRISGAFFFGATAAVGAVLDRIGASPKLFILDFADVPLVDSTAARTLEGFAHKLTRSGTKLYFTSANRNVRRTLLAAGLRTPLVHYASQIEDAVASGRNGKTNK